MAVRQPYVVVGMIIPWSVPMIMFAFKVAPDLLCGNTVVLKSSEEAPLSSLKIASLAKEAGFPPGVLNVVRGFGESTGWAISLHMKVRKISFTGSVATGRKILKMAADSNIKNVSLELGVKSPAISSTTTTSMPPPDIPILPVTTLVDSTVRPTAAS